MDITDFLTELRGLGVSVSLEKEDLRLKAPKGVLSAELRSRLSERKPEIIAFLHKAEAAAHQLPAGLLPVPRKERMPLSFAQQRLWFLDQWKPGNPELNIPGALSLTGTLDVSILEKTLRGIIQRHESLRTTFGASDGKPFQTVLPAVLLSLPVVDLEALSPTDRESLLTKLITKEVHHRFDLNTGPLFHFLLIKRSKDEHIFLFIFHHIISDGWSIGLFSEELTTLYKAFYHNTPSPLPELPVQYVDYAVWQRDWLTGEVIAQQLSFWKEQLGENPPVLEFPTDFPRPAKQSGRGEVHFTRLSTKLTNTLTALANKEKCTLFMILLTGFKILLSRYSGQKDIVVGSPIAGRNWKEVEGIFGFFLNSLALRTDLSGDPDFLELLGRVKAVTLGAYAHQDIPFEKLLEELEPERDLSRTPLFQVFFNMLNLPGGEIELPDLKIANFPLPVAGSKFDFTIYTSQKDESIVFNLVYCTDLFSRQRIVDMMDQYTFLLEQVVGNPRTSISQFSLVHPQAGVLLPDPRQALGDEWYGSVQELFSKQAKQYPEKTAVLDKDEQWTYAELNNRANQLANYLAAKGIGLHDVVAIYGHRSASLVWGVWGILKAGAAFVILDPSYPASRLITCLRVVEPKGLLRVEAAGELPQSLEEFLESSELLCRLVLPPRSAAEKEDFLSRYSSDDPGIEVGADDIAFISFTSGSTGTPKGIMGRHGPLSHFLPWQQETFGLTGTDRFSMLSGLAHDPLQRDIFTSLCIGASLHIPDPDQIGTPGWLVTWMIKEGITIAHLTPAMLQLITQGVSEGENKPLPLRYALTVGDVLTRRDVARLKQFAPGVTFINLYGSTETQRAVGYLIVPADPYELPKEVIPLGRGVQDAQLLVLDEHRNLAGIGELGEICIRSPHVALGYLGDEKLTDERFITNPFTRQPGDRIYRTGDLGRYLPDGCVEFRGRMDFQVKVRGFRIELGEVEAVIGNHPDVREVVVVLREVQQDDKRLAAYYVPVEGGSISAKELRQYALKELPEFMVPSFFIEIDTLPLTPNGKIDRKALPAPDLSRSYLEKDFVPPRTPTEEIMAQIWCEVLGVDKVGARDNFFDLGGHSLLATQVVSRIRNIFKVELSLQALFENSTLADLAGQIESAGRSDQDVPTPLVPVERGKELPLSFAQQRLWFLDQWEPGNPALNIPGALSLIGNLDVSILEKCLHRVIQRQESLRTIFGAIDGKPFQTIMPEVPLSLTVVDLEPLSPANRESQLQKLLAEELQHRFDLNTGPLFHFLLIRRSKAKHIFLIIFHHIISDGWSLGLFSAELITLYKAFYNDEPAPYADLPVQYADFAVWQREWLVGEVMERQLSYWEEQLGDNPPVLEFPTDFPRLAKQSFQGELYTTRLSGMLTDRLTDLANKEGCTLFMVLLTGFKVLLSRYSGQKDIVVGSPVAGRNWMEVEGIIGFFLNSLALRTDLSGDPDFLELLARVKAVTLGAYAHQDIPFEKLLEELEPERDLSRTPLFQVFFNMLNLPGEKMELPDLKIEGFPLPIEVSKFDFTIYTSRKDESIVFGLVYCRDLFSRERMVEMMDQYKYLLDQVVENPRKAISQYSLVTPQARALLPDPSQALGNEWYGSVQELFSKQAQQFPEKAALLDKDEQWTYAELNNRANQLAYYLLAQGIGLHDVVAIYGHRSASLVWGIWGILKAGAAFVILDPSYPASRLIACLRLADPKGLLRIEAAGELPQSLAEFLESSELFCHLVLPPRSAAEKGGFLSRYASDDPGIEVGADDIAFISFTSGSTGTPKGIMGRHGPLSHFLPWQQETFALTGTDRFSMLSGLAHDPLQRDIFTSLCIGASLHIPDPDQIGKPGWLYNWMIREGITIAHLTPAMLQLITQSISEGENKPLPLRYALTVGDVLTRRDVVWLKQFAPGVTFINLYGSTETQRAVGYLIVPADPYELPKEVIPLGRGVQDAQLLVLDEHRKLAGIGELGEICIRSPYLALGYLGDEKLTDERFITNPFTRQPGDRIYRTGDLGRYLPDGCVEFRGRMDSQVKVRGFRIELGEVEAVIGNHPDVREVVVALREVQQDDKRLAAYYVPVEGSSIGAKELRQYVLQELPDFMVPSFFVEMDAIPLTPNGKLDRKALPAPDLSRSYLEKDFVPPRTPTEEIMAKIWSEVLGVDKVGARDNFFELGGHSLLATQVVSRIRNIFKVELSLQALFENSTLAGLAGQIESAGLSDQALPSPLAPVERESNPLSFAQQRLWFLDQFEPNTPAYNIYHALRLSGHLDQAVLRATFREIVRRHESLRTVFVSRDGKPSQVISPVGRFMLPIVDLSQLPVADGEQTAMQLVLEEANRPFNLAIGPLFRVTLLRLSETNHILLLTIHHIVSDGWSMGILISEFKDLYTAFYAGKSSPLADLPVQYGDFSIWQREWLSGDVLESQLSYWRGQLGGDLPVLELPSDYPRPAVQTFSGKVQDYELPVDLARKLNGLAREEGGTFFMVLLSVFKVLLNRYTGQTDIAVGSPIANRNRLEIEGLIGFFVNTLVLRTSLGGNPTFRELLSRVREVSLGAYAHQDVPFEMLVDVLSPERNLSQSPLFQVLFALQNMPRETLELPDLRVKFLGLERQTSKFDLSMYIFEHEKGLWVRVEYNTDLFSESTIDRFFGHYRMLLESVVSDPKQLISELTLLTPAEREKLLVEWNDTVEEYPEDKCIHELFEARCDETPDRVAAVFSEHRLTYGELDARADQLAHYLCRLDVKEEVLVGVCLERTLEMMWALLGIFKAGGCYVPLDPTHPRERLALILEDICLGMSGKAPILLSMSQFSDLFPGYDGDMVFLDTEHSVIEALPRTRPQTLSCSNHLAYTIFTSGSTGRPKGVQISHRGVVNFLNSMSKAPGLNKEDILLSVTTLSFDISVLEFFLPLIRGAFVVLVDSETGADGAALLEKLTDSRATIMQATPATWHLLTASGWFRGGGVKTLCGGEELPRGLADELLSREVSLWNMYGPTETTIWSSVFKVEPGFKVVSIGGPIGNTRMYVLDRYLNPVPVGVFGELYIGGDGVSRGYLNRPDLTAECFIHDPFGNSPGSRLYRTGDLVRYMADGNIEFLGRMDFQVKVRGFRIELGEIEAVMAQHPDVNDVVAMVREDHANDKRIAAYFIPAAGSSIGANELRLYLSEKLPGYMVPSDFVKLETFPLTPNGKVDRKALPVPDRDRQEIGVEFIAPRTPTEETLIKIWCEILRLDRIGIRDNFFHLGGHSLLATQVISRIRDELRVEIPVRSIFESPVVAQLAEVVDNKISIQSPTAEDTISFDSFEEGKL